MRTKPRSRAAGLILGAFAAVAFAPERASAQQTGLFPLAPIRRQRTPVDVEDQVYKTYRQKYFGYHPTCWRRFPEGWGCPSKEAPNREESFRKYPLGTSPSSRSGVMPPEDGDGGAEQPEIKRPGIPAVPGTERSPFSDLDNAGPAAKPAKPRPPANNDDPFGPLDAKPETPPPARPAAPPVAPGGGNAPQARNRAEGEPLVVAESDDAPVLEVPAISAAPADDGAVFDPGATHSPAQQPTSATRPAQRKGILSSLWGNITSGLIRR